VLRNLTCLFVCVLCHSADEDAKGEHPVRRPQSSGRQSTKPRGATPRASTPAEAKGEEDDTFEEEINDDGAVEVCKDRIMRQLEESAFSVEEAHRILTSHLGQASGDRIKDAVLAEWCGEVGLSTQVERMSAAQRIEALDKVAKWLFQ
jgi:hypothetical protein